MFSLQSIRGLIRELVSRKLEIGLGILEVENKLKHIFSAPYFYNGLAENCDFQIADECQTATYFSSNWGKYRFSAARCKLKTQNSSIYAGEVY